MELTCVCPEHENCSIKSFTFSFNSYCNFRTLAQGKISLKECLTNPKVEIKQALLDANNKKLDDCFLFLTVCYNGAQKKSGAAGGGASGGAAGAEGGEGGDAAGMFSLQNLLRPGKYSFQFRRSTCTFWVICLLWWKV